MTATSIPGPAPTPKNATTSTSTTSSTSSTTKTPPRHNYSNSHTPITSIKRPRSSLRRASLDDTSDGALSPMHPARPPVVVEKIGVDTESGIPNSSTIASAVGRKIDALFSPVLRLLDTHEQVEDGLEKEDSQPPTASTASTASSSDSPASTVSTHHSTLEMDHHHDTDELSIQGQEMPESDEFNPWQFIQSLPPYSQVQHLRPPVTLPPKDPHAPALTLVLDLDETLVHCSVEPTPDPDLVFPVEFHGVTYQVHVQLRPFLMDFLQALQGKFELILFTASQKIYANELWNRIDPDGIYIQQRLYRESCLAVEGNFLKDLNVLGRDLSKTILVDNSPHAFGYQVDNGIPIESWFEDPSDRELLKLRNFLLHKVYGTDDVRPILRNKFQCQQLVDEAPAFYMEG